MTDKQISTAYGETANYTDPEAYVSDLALSSIFLPPDDPNAEVDPALLPQLRDLWHVANDPFRALLRRLGLTQTQCATRFCVPLRTVQDWAGERRACVPYIRLMMAEAADAVDLRREG